MAYVYRHIRLDKNEPFYIGKGVDKWYRRASSKDGRNSYWHHIVNKHGFETEVIIDDLSPQQALEKEKEFILIYGRIGLGTGTLVNATAGGDGVTGWSNERREKFIKSRTGKKATEETIRRLSESHKGYKPTQEALENMRRASKSRIITKETREKMASKLRGRTLPQWQREILSKAAMGKKVTWSYKPITQYFEGSKIKDYESITAAANELNLQKANITKVVNGQRKHTGGFQFKLTSTT